MNTCSMFKWGTSTWTKVTMDFIVEAQYPSDQWSAYTPGQMVAPSGIIPWFQVWSSINGADDNGQAWFGGPELYINP